MNRFHTDGQAVVWSRGGQTLRVEPWGADCLRVRCTELTAFDDRLMALIEPPKLLVLK